MTNDHLDDELLSASLDGETGAPEAAHLEACAACRARRTELERVTHLIADVEPPAADVRDAQIARALDATSVARVVSIDTARRARRLPMIAAAAAAVLGLLAGVGMLLNREGSDDTTTFAADARDRKALSERAAGGGTAAGSSLAANDLGVLRNHIDLRNAIAPFLMTGPAPVLASPAPTDDGAGSSAGAVDSGAVGTSDAGRDADTAAPETMAQSAQLACEPAARAALAPNSGADARELVTQATATWQDRPAVVYAFRGVDPSTFDLVVTAADDCTVLTTTTATG